MIAFLLTNMVALVVFLMGAVALYPDGDHDQGPQKKNIPALSNIQLDPLARLLAQEQSHRPLRRVLPGPSRRRPLAPQAQNHLRPARLPAQGDTR